MFLISVKIFICYSLPLELSTIANKKIKLSPFCSLAMRKWEFYNICSDILMMTWKA